MPPAATTSAGALQNLQSFESGQQSPSQVQQANNTSLGVPAAQQQVSGLRGAINNTTQLLQQVAPSVMGATQNSLVTQSQANSQIANKQAPLNDQLNTENTDYSNANSDLTNLTNQANTLTGDDMTGQQNQLSYLQGIYSDLANSEQQAQTNALQEEPLKASEAASASSGTGSSGTGGSPVGSMMRNSVGGYEFTGANGQPVTMGAYLAANGATPGDILQKVVGLLGSSQTGGDKGTANAISSGHYTIGQLEQLYPQIFGGM